MDPLTILVIAYLMYNGKGKGEPKGTPQQPWPQPTPQPATPPVEPVHPSVTRPHIQPGTPAPTPPQPTPQPATPAPTPPQPTPQPPAVSVDPLPGGYVPYIPTPSWAVARAQGVLSSSLPVGKYVVDQLDDENVLYRKEPHGAGKIGVTVYHDVNVGPVRQPTQDEHESEQEDQGLPDTSQPLPTQESQQSDQDASEGNDTSTEGDWTEDGEQA